VVGSGATDAALTAGMLKDIINAPSTAFFEGGSGEVFATAFLARIRAGLRFFLIRRKSFRDG
jgi:hypothetical protein